MAKTSEWDPVNGTFVDVVDDPQTGGVFIHTHQDVKPSLDWAKKQRNSGNNDPGGARDNSDLKNYATIYHGQIIAMREKGINVWDPSQTKEMIREIERNYPLCKVTNRKILG